MLATINTLPHFEHEVIMARLAWSENSQLNACYHIARAMQLYILLNDHDIEYLESNSHDILDAFYAISCEIDELRDQEDKNI